VQMRLLNVSDKNNVHTNLNMHFEHTNATLRVYDAYLDGRMEGDPPLADAALLRPYGINDLNETFAVEQLTGSRSGWLDTGAGVYVEANYDWADDIAVTVTGSTVSSAAAAVPSVLVVGRCEKLLQNCSFTDGTNIYNNGYSYYSR